ncbi:hypothetical protein AQUCO_01300203v1 [Aquilegia coerulea]|uniref:Uncharacterized protein n=1 Tax=Aquilegia coerulea TaxID=218851 RepID=A0A2G5E0X2_AQUCA|nr:hypothetical protein AQUCO_01300203v1 [Aquilegia coerulea]PIA49177.1 hypothetical protein AQUCO_01300203v1 [Aquilegia coerulea]
MPPISVSKPLTPTNSFYSSSSSNVLHFTTNCPFTISKSPLCPQSISFSRRKTLILAKSSETELSVTDQEWLKKLPEKNKPLYAHSLPGIEAWLKKLGFFQSREDRAVWYIEKSDWHAQLALDITDLYIRYLKSGPGNLEKDVERRFSYALSREDIENAILGGP